MNSIEIRKLELDYINNASRSLIDTVNKLGGGVELDMMHSIYPGDQVFWFNRIETTYDGNNVVLSNDKDHIYYVTMTDDHYEIRSDLMHAYQLMQIIEEYISSCHGSTTDK